MAANRYTTGRVVSFFFFIFPLVLHAASSRWLVLIHLTPRQKKNVIPQDFVVTLVRIISNFPSIDTGHATTRENVIRLFFFIISCRLC